MVIFNILFWATSYISSVVLFTWFYPYILDIQDFTSINLLYAVIISLFCIGTFIKFFSITDKMIERNYSSVNAGFLSLAVFLLYVGLGWCIFFYLPNYLPKQQRVEAPIEKKYELISSPLSIGSSGEDVKILQIALSRTGSIYPSGLISGYYGQLTKEAVVNFQRENSLSQTGEVDSNTIAKFNENYGSTSREEYLSLIPTNTPINTTVSSNQVIADSDPIVNCGVNTNCGGGTRQIKQSDCNNSTCCQIGDKWYFYLNKSQCTIDQNNRNNQNVNNVNLPTYSPLPTWAPLPTWSPNITPLPSVGTINIPAVPQMTKSQCQSNVNDRYRSQMTSMGCSYPCPSSGSCGSTSACDAMWSIAQSAMNSCDQYQ